MATIKTLTAVSKLSKYCGFTKLCYFLNRNKKRVIAYHNIMPDNIFDDSIHLEHSTRESSFIKHIKVIKKKFNIDLDIENKKTVTVTFDDGYLNQYEIASKIMDKFNSNGYFFLVESLINNKKIIPIDIIQFWISYVHEGVYNIKEINFLMEINNKNRREVWESLSKKILEDNIDLDEIIIHLDNLYPIKKLINSNIRSHKLRLEPIGKDEIQQMKKNGHIIGAHSSNHKRLSTLKKNELDEDIKKCNDMIGVLYNTKTFCYPYGSIQDISDEVITALKKYNFKRAFSYSNSPIVNYEYNDFFIPRMYLPDTEDKDLIEFVISGAKHMITFRKKLP
ncbi:MAG: polysaccharide deacetylase family protein [Clostridium sp.]|uniref:polysaccharide deacetylase family protein n=1 Tax=Clostridium sp. TaxID=1506 RepID=UPI003F34DE1D